MEEFPYKSREEKSDLFVLTGMERVSRGIRFTHPYCTSPCYLTYTGGFSVSNFGIGAENIIILHSGNSPITQYSQLRSIHLNRGNILPGVSRWNDRKVVHYCTTLLSSDGGVFPRSGLGLIQVWD